MSFKNTIFFSKSKPRAKYFFDDLLKKLKQTLIP
jgi:hypothetical protein